jgi:hypothetical protein
MLYSDNVELSITEQVVCWQFKYLFNNLLLLYNWRQYQAAFLQYAPLLCGLSFLQLLGKRDSAYEMGAL